MTKVECKQIAEDITTDIKNSLSRMQSVKLAIIDAGSDSSSKKYISLKMQKAIELGIKTDLIQFSENSKIEDVLTKINNLNNDSSVNGILIQLPLHESLAPYKHRLLNSINPLKDVDGLSAINFGLYSQDLMNGILPATVDACLEVIKNSYSKDLPGTNVLIINNSDLIGKPLAMILSTLGCTVTIANEFSDNIENLLKSNNIVVSATGKGNLYKFSQLSENTLVIDVTSKLIEGKVVGDFIKDEDDLNIIYTPVPGGIGPITIACLLRNLINLTKLQGE